MPVIRRANGKRDDSNPNLKRLTLVNSDFGAGYLEMGELAIAPGKEIPLHIHPTHEEGIYILEGPLNYTLGDETGAVNAGDVILAPPRVKHGISNPGREPRRIIFIFPTTNVKREFL